MEINPEKQLFFDRLSPDWDYSHDQVKMQRISRLFRKYAPQMDAPVLDLGAGSGVLMPVIHDRLSSGSQFNISADISLSMLQQSRVGQTIAGQFNLLQADGHFLPLRDASLNAVVCFQVFPHFEHKDQVLAEISRVLRPGGLMLVMHLMDHHGLNALHAEAGRAVCNDRIWPATTLAGHILQYGFKNEVVEEKSDLYVIRSRRLETV